MTNTELFRELKEEKSEVKRTDRGMTLDEAIVHCCAVANEQAKCAWDSVEEHRQFAEWLRELKAKKSEVKRTDRGWAGHYIGANYCRYRRNTLLEYYDRKWVVSTVGGYVDPISGKFDTIGIDRWYETMAFVADDTPYHDADTSRELYFDSPWGIFAGSIDELKQKHPYVDNEADEMHEKIVEELTVKIQEYKHLR